MPTKRSRPLQPSIRRGDRPGGTRSLPREFDRLAAGEERERRPRPPRQIEIYDDRERILIPGTNNRDARAVYDNRLRAIRDAIQAEDQAAVGRGLLAVQQLRLFRARNVVNFGAFVTSLVGIALDDAEAAMATAAAAANTCSEPLADPLVALWLRSEAGLCENVEGASIEFTGSGDNAELRLTLRTKDITRAVEGLSAVGRQAAGLARHLTGNGAPPRRQDTGRQDGDRQGYDRSGGDRQGYDRPDRSGGDRQGYDRPDRSSQHRTGPGPSEQGRPAYGRPGGDAPPARRPSQRPDENGQGNDHGGDDGRRDRGNYGNDRD